MKWIEPQRFVTEPAIESTDTIRHPKKRAFLAAYRVFPTVRSAADAAGIDRTTHYVWLDEIGPDGDAYREAFKTAREDAIESLETEAYRRAVYGVPRLQLFKGKPIFVWKLPNGTIVPQGTPGANEVALYEIEYSDKLLIVLLNANLPGKYKWRRGDDPLLRLL